MLVLFLMNSYRPVRYGQPLEAIQCSLLQSNQIKPSLGFAFTHMMPAFTHMTPDLLGVGLRVGIALIGL